MTGTISGERLDFDPRDAQAASEADWRGCEWPVSTGNAMPTVAYRTLGEPRTCGRWAAATREYEMHLCWQHREIWVRDAAHMIRQGLLSVVDTAVLMDAVLSRLETAPLDQDDRHRVERTIGRLLSDFADDPTAHSQYLRESVDRIVEDRLRERIEQQWGDLA